MGATLANYYNATNPQKINNQGENGQTQQKENYNNGGFWGGVGYTLGKAGTGAASFFEGAFDYVAGGIAKLFGGDEWAEELFATNVSQEWSEDLDEWYNPDDGWKLAGDVASGIGQNIAAIGTTTALTVATGGALAPFASKTTAVLMGLSAAGNATSEAYAKTGELTGREFLYGAQMGAIEGALEKVMGAGSKVSARLLGKKTAKVIAKKSVIKGLASEAAGEAIEEGLSEMLTPHIQRRMEIDVNAKDATWQEIGYSSLVGAISGVLLGEGANVYSTVQTTHKGNQIVKDSQKTQAVVDSARKFAAFEKKTQTGNEGYQRISELVEEYDQLDGSSDKTKSKRSKLLGEMFYTNSALTFSPAVERSKNKIKKHADEFVEIINARQITDAATGKPFYFKDGAELLKNKEVLTQFAVSDTLGELVLNTDSIYEFLQNKRPQGISQTDFSEFQRTATKKEKQKLGGVLHIDVDKATYTDFMKALKSTDRRALNDLKDELYPRRSLKQVTSEEHRVDDGKAKDELAVASAAQAATVTDQTQANAPQTESVSLTDLQQASEFAWSNVKGYRLLSGEARAAVDMTLAAGKRYGLTDTQIKNYGAYSAITGEIVRFAPQNEKGTKNNQAERGVHYNEDFVGKTVYIDPNDRKAYDKLITNYFARNVAPSIKGYKQIKNQAEQYYESNEFKKKTVENELREFYKKQNVKISQEMIDEGLTARYVQSLLSKRKLADTTKRHTAFMEEAIKRFAKEVKPFNANERLANSAYSLLHKMVEGSNAYEAKTKPTATPSEGNGKHSTVDSSGRKIRAKYRSLIKKGVVDANGRLLRLYHGTGQSFNAFAERFLGSATGSKSSKGGFFLTSSFEMAEGYADRGLDRRYADMQAKFLKSPKEIRRKLATNSYYYKTVDVSKLDAEEREFVKISRKLFEGKSSVVTCYVASDKPYITDMKRITFNDKMLSKIIDKAKKQGYDCVVFRNLDDSLAFDGKIGDVVCAFKGSQIKIVSKRRPAVPKPKTAPIEKTESLSKTDPKTEKSSKKADETMKTETPKTGSTKIDETSAKQAENALQPKPQLLDNYTEKAYNNFGWARVNNVLSTRENADFKKKFGEIKSGKQKEVRKTANGEIIVPVNDLEKGKHGVNNVLVYAKGSYDNYKITRIIRINLNNETSLEIVRGDIYDNEQRRYIHKEGDFWEDMYGKELVREYTPQTFPNYQESKARRGR